MVVTLKKFSWTTFTVTIASPAIFSATAHNLVEGDIIIFETTGALPTGLAVDTKYIVLRNKMTDDAFTIVSGIRSSSGVIGSSGILTPLNTSGTQSGTHTFLKTNNPKIVPLAQNNR